MEEDNERVKKKIKNPHGTVIAAVHRVLEGIQKYYWCYINN